MLQTIANNFTQFQQSCYAFHDLHPYVYEVANIIFNIMLADMLVYTFFGKFLIDKIKSDVRYLLTH